MEKDHPAHRYLMAFTSMLGTLMEVVDTSVANVSLPHMQGTFSAGVDEITWVITSYLVANAVVLPITGWLANHFGRKRFYLSCLTLFTIASLGSGAAPTLPFLVVMRVIQGLAGGAMVPMSQAILLDSFPREERGKAMALFGVGVVFGPIIGPTLGGWITDTWGWRWVFYINIPVGMLGLLLGLMHITDPPYLRRREGKVDVLSFLFICAGLGSLEVFLNRGQRFDWFDSNFIKFFGLTAVAGVALFIWRSLTAENPLVDLRVFKNRSFASATVLMFLLGFGLFGSFTMLPLYVQSLMRYTATWAGLVISPGGVASLVAMVVVAALIGKVDTRLLVLLGGILNITAIWLLQSVDLDVSFGYVMLSRLVQGFGLGFLFVPISTAAFSHLPPEQIGQATGLFNLLRNEGGSTGIALSATVLARHAQLHQARLMDHVTPYAPVVQERLAAAARGLFPVAGLDPTTTQALSTRMLYGQIVQQALVKAYVDVFWMLTLAFVLFLPFILMLSGETGRSPSGAH
ncbi:MAG TPA: DHA2 family efflux MFS transporter permease subunit [Thermoanaerobaculaceae bacterium]|nr:DHA2 family efflux MFS transporter permease subunit [Thermoanaerobaculaceae bacterium]